MTLTFKFIQPGEFDNPHYDIIADNVYQVETEEFTINTIGTIKYSDNSHKWRFVSLPHMMFDELTLTEIGIFLEQVNASLTKQRIMIW